MLGDMTVPTSKDGDPKCEWNYLHSTGPVDLGTSCCAVLLFFVQLGL